MIAIDMESALDDVAFLALSENRVAFLTTLSDQQPHARDELMDAIDVSRPTLARILDDLEERAWITQHGQTCRITSLGAWVHDEFTGLLTMMDTARRLRAVEQWLSAETLSFDLSRLADAGITLPSQNEPLAPMHRASELERVATRSRLFTHALPVLCLDAHWEAITTASQQFEAVVTPRVVETMTKPPHASQFEDILAAERATVFVYDGTISDVVGINDGVVYFGIDDDKGAPLALIETDDEAIRAWAEETFESYRERSSRLTLDRYSEIRETAHESSTIAELVDAS
jgi:predicted transcriptional regulator